MLYIGKLDRNTLGKYKDKIITNDVLISEERIEHIEKHHPELENNEILYISDIIKKPDYIFNDRKNESTILMVKEIVENKKSYRLVVKLNTNKKFKEKSNTIISFWNISKKKLGQFKRNEEILYEKLDNNE